MPEKKFGSMYAVCPSIPSNVLHQDIRKKITHPHHAPPSPPTTVPSSNRILKFTKSNTNPLGI